MSSSQRTVLCSSSQPVQSSTTKLLNMMHTWFTGHLKLSPLPEWTASQMEAWTHELLKLAVGLCLQFSMLFRLKYLQVQLWQDQSSRLCNCELPGWSGQAALQPGLHWAQMVRVGQLDVLRSWRPCGRWSWGVPVVTLWCYLSIFLGDIAMSAFIEGPGEMWCRIYNINGALDGLWHIKIKIPIRDPLFFSHSMPFITAHSFTDLKFIQNGFLKVPRMIPRCSGQIW